MRRLRRAVADLSLVAALGLVGVPLVTTISAFSSATSSPANSFTNLTVAASSLDPAAVSSGSVQLSWTASATVASESGSYLVMRRPSGGSYAQVASTGSLAYTDAPGDGSWEYLVRAAVSSFSADSNSRGVSIDLTPPTAASGVTAATGSASGSVDLAWAAGTDATSGVSGYTIHYVQANSCPAPGAGAYPTTVSVGAVTSQSVGGLVKNKNYCFYLVTSDAAGNASGPSNVASAKAK